MDGLYYLGKKKVLLIPPKQKKAKRETETNWGKQHLNSKIQHLENNEKETVQVHGVFSQQSSAVWAEHNTID